MANEYISPTAYLPTLDTGDVKVPAGLAAQQNWMRTQNYKDQFALSQLGQQFDMQEKQGKLSDYFQTRDSKNQSDIATNLATASTIGQLKGGEAMSAEAKGLGDRATWKDNAATKLAENMTTRSAQPLAQMRNMLNASAIAMQVGGPQAPAQFEEIGRQAGAPPEWAEMAKRLGPKGIMELLQATNAELQGNLEKQRQDNQQKGANELATATETGKWNLKGHEAAANATVQSARIQAEVLKSTDQSIAKLEEAISEARAKGVPDSDPAQASRLEHHDSLVKTKTQIELMKAATQQAMMNFALGKPSNMPTPEPITYPRQSGPQPATGKFQINGKATVKAGKVGVTITSKNANGTYEVVDAKGKTGTFPESELE